MSIAGIRMRRRTAIELVIVLLSAAIMFSVGIARAASSPEAADEDHWTFVTIPDFTNEDVDHPEPRWDQATDYTLDRVAEEDPDFVLVAGDLVMGHWESRAEIREQSARYYGAWKARMRAHGLTYYASMGDHEVGDNPWPAQKAALVPEFKRAFATHLQMPAGAPEGYERTAWSLRHKNLLLTAIDPFELDEDGQLQVGVTGEQLSWVNRTLETARDDEHVVLTSNIPILPTAYARSSSRMQMPGGAGTPIWEVMRRQGVDAYLAGEMHDASVQSKDGVLQIISGSFAREVPELNYLVTEVYSDRLEFELKAVRLQISETALGPEDPAYADSEDPEHHVNEIRLSPLELALGPRSLGAMTLRTGSDGNRFEGRSGYFTSRYTGF
jgi:hypothetical protein